MKNKKNKSRAVETHGGFNFKSTENVSDRHVFEKLCLDTSLKGFSYDPDLLVNLDKVSSFDEACIRLTTKCGSIITQLSSVGHSITHFAVTAATTVTGTVTSPKTPKVPKIPDSPVPLISSQFSPSSLYFLDSQTSPMLSPSSLAKPKFHGFDDQNNGSLTPQDHRNIRVMSELWGGLKKKNYTGMIAVARVTGTSILSKSSKDRYSIKALTDTLLSNVKGYFMFQNFSSNFDKDFENSVANNNGKNNNSEPGSEYLLYVVYRSKAAVKETKKDALKHKSTESEKLSSPWSTYVSGSSRKLRHESGDSAVSSCSSVGSSTSGGPCSFSSPSGNAPNLRLDISRDTVDAGNTRNIFTNPQSYSSPQTLRYPPTSQGRKLIIQPSPSLSPKAASFGGVKGQKLFSPKAQPAQSSVKSPPASSQRNLRHQPYNKLQQDNKSSSKVANDTVSKAITVAIASLSQKAQPQKPQSMFATQLEQQQQKIAMKNQTSQQFAKSQHQQAKTSQQVQRQQPTRLQQQKSQETTTTAKPAFKSLLTKTVSPVQRVPITAPKSDGPTGPTKNLRSSPAAPVAISQRNLRHSFSKK